MSTDVEVVIVGAGAAGVGAARRLVAAGLSPLVLEATSRVGGRGWTEHVVGLPLDLGCGWLHSADRNAWTRIAEGGGRPIDRRRPAWRVQYRGLGFPPAEQTGAQRAFADWVERLASDPPASDRAADALEPNGEWNAYIEAINGLITGARLDRLSVADYMAYDAASTDQNWRLPGGYGALIAASLPPSVDLRLATPVEAVALDGRGVTLTTPEGRVHAAAAILTVSTVVLAGGRIGLPSAADPWRDAAGLLPLGRDEKLFLRISDVGAFEPETRLIGDPRNPRTGVYYIRPLERPVIECFFGGEGASLIEDGGAAAGFAFAIDQLAHLLGSAVRRTLHPLIASGWSRMTHVGGAYSYALPGHAAARAALARPLDRRLFFAGEATHPNDFSTAHGAHDSGVRAAEQVIAALAARPDLPEAAEPALR
ncbi:MAG: flavin monoamine oxidase family protein [Alphaproteobacteria bacterium]